MKTKILSIFAAVVFVFGAAVIMPTVSAQGQLDTACANAAKPAMTVSPSSTPDAPIRPVTDTGQVKFDVTYKVDSGGGTSVTPVTLSFETESSEPGYTTISHSPASIDVNVGQDGADVKETITVDIAFDKTAPAFKTVTIELTASGTPGTCVTSPTPKTEKTQVKVGFYEQVQAAFTSQIFKTGQNSQVSVPMKVDNFGNGAVQMRFAINPDLTSKELKIANPAPIIVTSIAQGGETSTAEFTVDVKTPFKNGYENRQDSLVMDISGTSADNTNVNLQPLQVSAVIQTQGVYVPGFEAVTLLGAVLAMAFVARRRF